VTETEGFREFVTARYAALVRFGILLTGDHGHGEDLVQNALVTVYRAWRRLYPDGDPEAYARRVMTRAARRAARRLWRRELPSAQLPDVATENPYDARDTAELVIAALRALPGQQRVVLMLRYWGGLSEQEIADQLRCSPGTVKRRANRAIATRSVLPSTAIARSGPADDASVRPASQAPMTVASRSASRPAAAYGSSLPTADAGRRYRAWSRRHRAGQRHSLIAAYERYLATTAHIAAATTDTSRFRTSRRARGSGRSVNETSRPAADSWAQALAGAVDNEQISDDGNAGMAHFG
jgi:RNA polymerase sigma-70 factor (sigma-E family)